MPRLKRAAPHLRRDGPTLEVQIELVLDAQKVMQDDGDEVPSVVIKALIDTDASGTLVQTLVVEGMGLSPFDTALLSTPSTTELLRRRLYRVRLVFSKIVAFETNVVEGPLIGQNVQCLIGRDILEEVVFTYDGPGSRFTISAP